MDEQFQWVAFYEEFADKLHTYVDRTDELFEIIKDLQSKHKFFNFLHFENDEWWSTRNYHIDPFTVLAVMNRQMKHHNRTEVGHIYAEIFNIHNPVPTIFSGIPTVNNMSSFFNDDNDDKLWTLFDFAIKFSETKTDKDKLIESFDQALEIKGNVLPKLTMGLFWIRPRLFMPLDDNSRKYISSKYQIKVPSKASDGIAYLEFLEEFEKLENEKTFYEISHDAWMVEDTNHDIVKEENSEINISNEEKVPFNMDKNIILYGPPGTGKTYSSVLYAVSIIEETPFEEIQSEDYNSIYHRYLQY